MKTSTSQTNMSACFANPDLSRGRNGSATSLAGREASAAAAPLPFKLLHECDLAAPGSATQSWPERMCLLQIQETFADQPGKHLCALLVVAPSDRVVQFGISLDFVFGQALGTGSVRGIARFVPKEVEWPPPGCSCDEHKRVAQEFHEHAMHSLFPQILVGTDIERQPTPALLVKLSSPDLHGKGELF